MTDENPLLKQAISLSGDPDAIRKFYADWAETYDADLLQTIGYVGPRIAAEALVKRLPKTALVLDAGCGTGVSTDYLAHLNPGAEILAVGSFCSEHMGTANQKAAT